MAPLTTSVEPLDGNKVRLRVAVPAEEFEKAVDAAFRKLAREVKVPGFRPGKVPRQLLEARLGSDVAREQALRDALPDYYAEAVAAEDIDVIAPPEIDLTGGEESGDIEFDAVVEVRPTVTLHGYDGLHVEIPSIEGLTATDFLYEVGSGMVVPKLDDELRGKRAGDILKFNDELPERFGERAGQDVAFQVLVKETKRKVLPEPTDEWASEVSEFDTIEQLRDDARNRLALVAKVQAQMAVRDKVLEAVSELVDIEIPDPLVGREMESRLHDLVHRLEAQGATVEQYLAATGQEQDAFIGALRQGAIAGVRADLALRSVVAQEGIEATDDEVDAEITRLAERLEEKPEKVRRDLERRGAIEAVRSDIARGKALQFLVEQATVVDESGNPVDLTLPDGEAADNQADNQANNQDADSGESTETPETHEERNR